MTVDPALFRLAAARPCPGCGRPTIVPFCAPACRAIAQERPPRRPRVAAR